MKDMQYCAGNVCKRTMNSEPLDIYKAQATKFQIIDGKLMPPYFRVSTVWEKRLQRQLQKHAKDGPYLSTG